MPDLPQREAFVPRHAVTHELTEDGLKVAADQVVTVPAEGDAVSAPLGEVVHAGTVVMQGQPPVADAVQEQPGPLLASTVVEVRPVEPAPPPAAEEERSPASSSRRRGAFSEE